LQRGVFLRGGDYGQKDGCLARRPVTSRRTKVSTRGAKQGWLGVGITKAVFGEEGGVQCIHEFGRVHRCQETRTNGGESGQLKRKKTPLFCKGKGHTKGMGRGKNAWRHFPLNKYKTGVKTAEKGVVCETGPLKRSKTALP